MTRQEKYPGINTFHYYNVNSKNKITTDCVTRDIATALKQDYNKTVMELAEMQCETGYNYEDKKLYDKYLQNKGWVKHPQPCKVDNTKYTGKEFCTQLTKYNILSADKSIIANIGGNHIVCIKEHNEVFKVHDI